MNQFPAAVASRLLASSPLRHTAFRLFYFGSIGVALGYTMQATIAAWLMATLTPSPLMVALVQTASTAPTLLFGLVAGTLADIVERRKIILATLLVLFASTLILGGATIVGITRGTTRAHLARAAVEAMAFQTRDVVEAMRRDAGLPLTELKADGGASAMDLLMQFQADLLGVPVRRPEIRETTAMGAAYLAGLGEGLWSSREEVAVHWRLDREFRPAAGTDADDGTGAAVEERYARWREAVQRSLRWAST